MKNWINFYYDINEIDIHQVNLDYFFEKDNYDYIFFQYVGEISNLENIYNLSRNLIHNGIYCHEIILNNDMQIYTNINGKSYVLLKCCKGLDKKITFDDVINFMNVYIYDDIFRCDNWKKLWIEKLNYFEYQLSQFGNNHILLRNSFNYFSGYVETGIMLLDNIYVENKKLILSHRRITNKNNLLDLYNPFNFIIDYRVRDVSEFFKEQFIAEKNVDEIIFDIIEFFYISDFEEYEYQLFFIRMLYPTFYFDAFELIMNNTNYYNDNDILIPLIQKIDDYIILIKKLYNYMIKYTKLPNIEWLI